MMHTVSQYLNWESQLPLVFFFDFLYVFNERLSLLEPLHLCTIVSSEAGSPPLQNYICIYIERERVYREREYTEREVETEDELRTWNFLGYWKKICWNSRGQLKKKCNFQRWSKFFTQFYRISKSKALLNFHESWLLTWAFQRSATQLYRISKGKESFLLSRDFKGKVTNLKNPDPYLF